MIVAVYVVMSSNVASAGSHDTVPVYCAVGVIAVTGVAPSTGGVTPGMAARFIVCKIVVKLFALSVVMAFPAESLKPEMLIV